ncbi:MAG: class I SAM-dependent methyltransferase [Burkholderiales bacterium]
MSFYQRYVLPRLIDLAMRDKEFTRYRSRVVPQASGTVLEIGIGSGLNLPFYGPGVERLYALDPSPELLAMVRERAHAAAFPVDTLERSAEELPLEDACVDTVVTTFTLCSIPRIGRALEELKRVLRPNGALLFAEHGLAPDATVQRWQHRVNPLWRKVAGGCNLDRRIDALILGAGFALPALDTGYARGPRVLSYIYSGRAELTPSG